MEKDKRPKLIAVVGPTSSGKSALGVRLAKRFNGEVISADSRQIYRGLDIGTGKITRREMRGVPHHLLDITTPRKQFSVTEYQKEATEIIKNILRRKKVPILVGGTGFYIDAVTRGVLFPNIPPNIKLRKRLAKQSPARLSAILKRLDKQRWKTIDLANPRRVIRAIELAKALPHVPQLKTKVPYQVLYLAPHRTKAALLRRIRDAVRERIRRGLLRETKILLKSSSKKHLCTLALGYRPAIETIRGTISRKELIERYVTLDWNYAKRQMTWFKRNKEINWIKGEREGERLVKKFLARKK